MANFYLAQLKPFEDRNDKGIPDFQAESIENVLCGMGWGGLDDYFKGKEEPYYLEPKDISTKENGYAQRWLSAFGNSESSTRSINTALNCYNEMEPGDYVLTRLFETGKCYIGKVKSKAYHKSNYGFSSKSFNDRYSFAVDIEWKDIGSFSAIPNALRGLLQTSRQPTIKRISKEYDIARRIIVSLYENGNSKIKLTEENFSQSLDPLDLEDLVAHYMLSKNEGYKFIPSSCKDSEPTVEFTLFKGGKYITCQVKNRSAIDLKPLGKIADQYEKIYVFSGKNEYKNKCDETNNIVIIEQDELFIYLKEDFQKEGYFYHILNKYYYF